MTCIAEPYNAALQLALIAVLQVQIFTQACSDMPFVTTQAILLVQD